jgi:GTP-binding protein LepA
MQHIRNFSIIAHIDHGKSTLADRLLEVTRTIEKRKMRDQVLDSMDLERERGITIKMQPVRMEYIYGGATYELNLIDTPGHIDFSYEVSRALSAVEGALLLVDSTQGVQAQTLTTLRTARDLGLVIIPVLSKIDSPLARIDEVREQVIKLLGVSSDEVLLCSGRTGEGVEKLLETIIGKIPAPKPKADTQALIFDFQYSDHQGVIVYLRMFGGAIKKGSALEFAQTGRRFNTLEVGTFSPQPKARESLSAGSIGYVVTGIKEPGFARVGDTIRPERSRVEPLGGYAEPKPVVWASVYPESQDDFLKLRQALSRLRLSDSALSFEEESSGVLGRGFRCGLLGMLHLEIVTERLKREANLSLIVTTPTITYEVETKDGKKRIIYSPSLFPEHGDIVKVWEPYVAAEILLPGEQLGSLTSLLYEHEAHVLATENFSEGRMLLRVSMPLRELMRNFFDKVKSVSSGYASISYEIKEMREADVARLDILVAEDVVPAFTRIVAAHRAYEDGKAAVEKLYDILPRQMFATKIQAVALGRILSSKTLPAMSKNVTQHMYGGDRTRKMKLWKKQKEGKARMKAEGRVNIPEDVFLKMVKSD